MKQVMTKTPKLSPIHLFSYFKTVRSSLLFTTVPLYGNPEIVILLEICTDKLNTSKKLNFKKIKHC